MQKEIQDLENENTNLKIQLLEAHAIISSLQQENQSLTKRLNSFKNESYLSFDSTFVTSQFQETICENCDEPVASHSLELHQIQCFKQLTRCPACNERVQVLDMQSHFKSRSGTLVEMEKDIERGDIESFEMKMAHGARVDLVSEDFLNNSLIHLAVRYCKLEFIEYFIKRGIDINVRNASGESPLHLVCAKSKDILMVKYLVSKGAQWKVKNFLGDSCVDLAKRNGFHEAVLFFQQIMPCRPFSSMSRTLKNDKLN
jgi:hypothetical protein